MSRKIIRSNQDKPEKEVSPRAVYLLIASGIFLFFASFGFLIWAAIMQDKGLSDAIVTPVGLIGFFGCDIAAIILLVKALPHQAVLSYTKLDKKYDTKELNTFPFHTKQMLEQKLLKHKFRFTQDGYYHRKKFSFLKDSVTYYVRILDGNLLKNTVSDEMTRFENIEKKGRNFCLLLFIYTEQFNSHQQNMLRIYSKQSIILASIIPSGDETAVLPIAMDSTSQKGYFLSIAKGNSLVLYSYGCKLLKKLL